MTVSVLTRPVSRAFGEEQAFRMIADAGFDGIDYSMHLYELGDRLFDLPAYAVYRRYEALRRAAEACRLRVCQMHTLYPTYRNDAQDARRLEATKAGIVAAGALGCPYAVIHPMIPEEGMHALGSEAAWALNRDFYAALIPLLREHGVQAAVENMFSWEAGRYVPNNVSTAADMAAYIDRLNDLANEERFVACYDTGHAHLLGYDLYEEILRLGGRIRVLHLHDNARDGDAHTRPGLGTIDWPRVLRALREIHYGGPVSFEAHGYITGYPKERYAQALQALCRTGEQFAQALQGPAHIRLDDEIERGGTA